MTTRDRTDTDPDPDRKPPRALLFAGHGRGRKLVAALAAIAVLGSGSLLVSGSAAGAAQNPLARAADSAAGCSGYRWPVKTLSDPAAQSVNLTPKDTTIAALQSFPAHRGGPRIGGIETQTWKLSNVRLTGYRYQADGDVHLIATDGAGRTIIAELPNSKCTQGAPPAARAQIEAARMSFLNAYAKDTMPGLHQIQGTATISGVGFLDFAHTPAEPGAAPNGVELHPVLSFKSGG